MFCQFTIYYCTQNCKNSIKLYGDLAILSAIELTVFPEPISQLHINPMVECELLGSGDWIDHQPGQTRIFNSFLASGEFCVYICVKDLGNHRDRKNMILFPFFFFFFFFLGGGGGGGDCA